MAQGYVQNVQPNGEGNGVWTTTPFDCLKDEETCWWGTWCCCLLSARTAESLQVGSSYQQSVGFTVFVIISVVLSLILPPLGFALLFGGLAYYAYYKAEIRTKIRNILAIPGTIMSDFVLHCFCPCCAVAQEAREAGYKNAPALDYWYGEKLADIDFPQVERGGYVATSPTNAATDEGSGVSLIDHLKTISRLSHLILRMWLAVVFATFLALIISGRGLSLIVLILVFVQPFLILYFVYWRDPEKNKHVSLDYVIKLFAVGFFMSTSQSIVFESVLEGILGFVVGIVLVILNPGMNDTDDSGSDSTAKITAMLMPHFAKEASWGTLLKGAATNTYEFLISTSDYAGLSEHASSDAFAASATASYADGHQTYLPLASPVLTSTNGTDSGDSGFTPELMRKNFFIVIIALLVMAFVIAAGVEETMKHFAVRCCRFPAPLRDPKSALIYLMTAALGFATSENIEYVFGANKSPLPGTSLLVGELFVLLIRICMPVHVICSVMQATNLSKVLMGTSNMGIIEILLPAILLHGTFDFVLFLMGAIQAAFNVDDIAIGVMGYIVPIGITLVGVYLAYTGFTDVLRTFESGWQSVAGEPAQEVFV